ncbi:hypothetical protein OAT18_03505, partial [Tenacibaculum sp.]|nr:hypothetical protein [Tenacibaculum sp.]
ENKIMRFFTNFKYWLRPKKDREVYDILDTQLSACVRGAKSLGNGFRNTVGIKRLNLGVFDITKNIEELNSGCCDLEKKVAKKLAEYNLATDRFLIVDEDYHNLIRLEETTPQKNEYQNKKKKNDE